MCAVGILDGQAQPVVLMAALGYGALRNILKQLMDIGQVSTFFHPSAAEGNAGQMEGLLSLRHIGRHGSPAVCSDFIGVVQTHSPLNRFDRMVYTPPVRRMVVEEGRPSSGGTSMDIWPEKPPPVRRVSVCLGMELSAAIPKTD